MNSLVQALKKRTDKGIAPNMPQRMDVPIERRLELHGNEVGEKFYPGNKISIRAHGTVHSIHDDGRVMMKVNKVQLADKEDSADKAIVQTTPTA